MSGNAMKTPLKVVAARKLRPTADPQRILITPELATEMLEANQQNRPISDSHVRRITAQILAGLWLYNGDTIKIADSGDVLDGQHRLWAIIESKTAVESLVVFGIPRDAFATIDTIRQTRSLGDTVAVNGTRRHRQVVGASLAWLTRYKRGVLEFYKVPQNRIENSDIQRAYRKHPGILPAVERAMRVRSVANPSLIAFLYYVVADKNEALAERFIDTLADPAGVSVTDPFFKLRHYFTSDHHKRKEALVTIALMIKAFNVAARHGRIESLAWRQQGRNPEPFPALKV
jgi:hypothetical protein